MVRVNGHDEADQENDLIGDAGYISMKRLPIGYDDFKALRNEGRYYVDKSQLIAEIVNGDAQVFLFTRPRRFGKSLNISMLDAFFNLEYVGNTWFDGLKVEECEDCMKMKNAHPVIHLDLKGLNVDDERLFDKTVRKRIRDLYGKYIYLKDSDALTDLQREYYSDIVDRDFEKTGPSESLKDLSAMLQAHHGKEVILLIDEYDNPIQNSYGTEVQKRIIAFMRNLLTNALKGNSALKLAVITGVMQIAKESIFSGLNNLYVNNILSSSFSEYFGFTEPEVRDLLGHCEFPEKFSECREWYDGYRFGESDIYNPWSILNYVSEKCTPRPYWAGTSGNEIIRTLLDHSTQDTWDVVSALSGGGKAIVDFRDQVVYSDIERDPSAIYSIMAMSGYLNAKHTDFGYEISIPNREVYQIYEGTILSAINQNESSVRIAMLFAALRNNDGEAIGDAIGELIRGALSSKILDSEHVYQSFLIGMMMGFCGNYRIFGDTLESGEGFADIRMECTSGVGPNIIIELKRSKDEKDLAHDASAALGHIRTKGYAHGLKGRTLFYGISFHKKTPFVLSEESAG